MKKYEKINLHTHSIYSDGLATPEELVDLAVRKELDLFSLTDHNNIYSTERFMIAAKKQGLKVIPGIELSCENDDIYLHLTGYGIDYLDKNLKSFFDSIYEKYIDINSNEDITKIKKYVHTTVEKIRFKPEEAIKLIHEYGGLVFIAHPILSFPTYRAEQRFRELRDIGLDGIEVCSIYNTYSETTYFNKLADELHLLKSSGTDIHDNDFTLYPDNRLYTTMKKDSLRWAYNIADKFK